MGGTSGKNIQTGIGPDVDCCVRMGGSLYLTFGVIAKVDFYSCGGFNTPPLGAYEGY